jgi:MIP family channel proteins
MKSRIRPALAELIGTFIFCFVGAGVVVSNSTAGGAVGPVGIAFAHGLVLAVLITSLGAISGGHFNPAVTVGLWVSKKADQITLVSYLIAQILGALLAGAALRAIFDPTIADRVYFGTPTLSGIGPLAGLALEMVLTFFLMLAVLGTSVDPMAPKVGGFGIGMAYAAGVLVAGPLTGAALNPARALGPAVVSGMFVQHWIYWVGPIAGAAAASWLYTRRLSDTI